MSDVAAAIEDAIEVAAVMERRGDWGPGLRRPPVNPSEGDVRKFKIRLIAFLREMPEEASVREMLEELT